MTAPLVSIEQGTVRGLIVKDVNGSSYYSFRGIPYAKPPVGQLRFKAPVVSDKWSGIFDATKEGSACYSRHMYRNSIIGSENCLNLNVYTKKLPDEPMDDLKPVMVWIYGGGYVVGSNTTEIYGPDFLIGEDVVIVVINYRLGLLGFLNFDDTSIGVPGNAGCKDMVMALKWVQNNIVKFNGDPNNVTIFGESAGGAAVSLLLLSPMAKGLFHKAIAQSGAALIPRALGKNCSIEISKEIGLEETDEKKIYEYLMEASLNEIRRIQESLQDNHTASSQKPIGPVIEKGGENAFLTEDPIDIIVKEKFIQVPFMAGYTTLEGLCFQNAYTSADSDFELHIPFVLGHQKGSNASLDLAKKIKEFYYGNEEPSKTNIARKINIVTDNMFLFGIFTTVQKQAAASKSAVYLYRMSIETSLNFAKELTGVTIPGVSHCDDLGYLFKNFATPRLKSGSLEERSIQRFIRLWANFARYGNPTPVSNDPILNITWNRFDDSERHFLDIGTELSMKTNPDRERIDFWKEIYSSSSAGKKYL